MYIISFTVAVLTSTFGYVVYLFLSSSKEIKTFISATQENNTNHIFFQRLTGVLIFGIIPSFILLAIYNFNMSDFGITSKLTAESVLWICLLAILIIPMNFLNSKKSDNLAMYPQIRKKEWSNGLLIASSLSWITYLFAYEMLFRGFLLFSSLAVLGYWPAILINTGIYSLVHYPKGNKEAFGAVPLGFILCILTIKTGNFWIALITHIILALSNEWFSIWNHGSIKLKK